MIIDQKIFEKVSKLHEESLHLQAYHEALKTAPLEEWEGTEAALLASHLAHNLGAPKLSHQWIKKIWRKDKSHPKALFYYANETFRRKGILPVLIFLRNYGENFTGDEKLTAWWQAMHSEIFSHLRDFTTAGEWHKKAVETAPLEPWVWVSHSYNLEQQDRYEQSLAASRRALELKPWYRGAVYAHAHALTLLERYDEALEILHEAESRIENAWIVKQLADLQTELGLYKEAETSLEKVFKLTPMRDEETEKWLFANLSDLNYLNGNIGKSIEFAGKSKNPFHDKIKERLEMSDGTEKRVKLNVGFLRQHFMTCAPATLANISRFWNETAEHLNVAEEICYNGTPTYKERNWANENDWETREFTVNWNDTVKLIDRGIPFTLATIQPGNGHLQAVIGYDARRRTLLVRDPFFQSIVEYAADELFENQAANGPRGMALVPRKQGGLPADLDLSESRIYDLSFRIDNALDRYERELAAETLAEMEREFPDHRLTLSARWTLARYDANEPEMLAVIEKLRGLFPDDINLKMSYASLSSEHKSRRERLEMLEEFAKGEKTDPLLWQMFGYELGLDPNDYRRALYWLYKTVRVLPTSAATYKLIADILWSQRNFADATKLYRFAASLNDKDENFAYSYFLAARHRKETDKALQFLRDRFDLFGHLSDKPVQSLFHALRELGRAVESFEVLQNALGKRPADGELKLFAAEAKARYGKQTEAEQLLEQAKGKSPETAHLKTSALMAEIQGDLPQALKDWREIVKIEPLSYDAHENIAFLTSAVESRPATLEYLRKLTIDFPYNLNFHKLRLGYLRDETEEALEILQHLLEINPQDLWIRREFARRLAFERKFKEASEISEEALRIDPNEPLNHWMAGSIYAELGKYEDAVLAYRKAVSLSVDADYAINAWINLCRTKKEKIAALKFIRERLDEQTNFGEGLNAYREQARRILEPEELLGNLRRIYDENPDSWFVRTALTQQSVDMGLFDEALDIALEAAEKYPLVPLVRHNLAVVYKVRGEIEKETESLRKALEINKNWSVGIQQYAEALGRAGRFEEAVKELEKAVARLPLDFILHGYLADARWKNGEKQAAIESARQAVTLEADYDWAWQVLKTWGEQSNQPNLAVEMARELTVRKPKDARIWTIYASLLDNGHFSQSQLDAAEEALKLEPKNDLALTIKANSLADARRFDEAIAVCKTTFSGGFRPERLRFAQAGIEVVRGNYEEAVRLLEKLTVASPDYYPAWEKLANIYRGSAEKKADYLHVTKNLTRLAPQDAASYGFLGEACELNDKRDEAKEAYRQAVVLAPDYEFAGCSLFDLYFEDGDAENCRNVLKTLTVFLKNELSLIREIVFYAKNGDLDKTERLWRELCLTENAAVVHFDYVFKHLREADLIEKDFVWKTLSETAVQKPANPLTGVYLLEHTYEKKGAPASREMLKNLRVNEDVWAKAVGKFYEIMLREDVTSIMPFIDKNSAELQASDDAWASTGYALISCERFEKCKQWFADWEKREKVQPWMLWNYSNALRYLGETSAANRISRKSLEITPDDTVNLHLMMLGLDELHAENPIAAEQFFNQVNPTDFTDWDVYFYNLLKIGLQTRYSAEAAANAEFDHLATETVKYALSQPNLREDKIKNDYFERSFKQILNSTQSLWLKFRLHSRVKLHRMGLLK